MTNSSPNSRRRFLRFSLRGLLLLVAVVGVGLGWALHEAREQAVAVAALEKVGCKVEYAVGGDPPTMVERMRELLGESHPRNAIGVRVDDGRSRCIQFAGGIRAMTMEGPDGTKLVDDAGLAPLQSLAQLETLLLGKTKVTDAGMRRLQSLARLENLNLDETKVTDVGLGRLQGLKRLKTLNLTDTQVSDAGLVYLEGLTQLEELFLGGTQVSDAGMVHLQGLFHLKVLDLNHTLITDAGLRHLAGLTKLRTLSLRDTPVTDAGLVHLRGLTQLQFLQLPIHLDWTGATAGGVAELQRTLPHLRIYYP